MENTLKSLGLDVELIKSKYPNFDEYMNIVKFYLKDEFFEEIGTFLENEDYALAKDACKGLFILAQDLYLYPLYITLMEVYEDLCEEEYKDVIKHYDEMKLVYDRFVGAINV